MLLVFFFDDASKVMQSFVFGSGMSNLYLDDINSSLPRTKGAFPDPAPRVMFTYKEDGCRDRLGKPRRTSGSSTTHLILSSSSASGLLDANPSMVSQGASHSQAERRSPGSVAEAIYEAS